MVMGGRMWHNIVAQGLTRYASRSLYTHTSDIDINIKKRMVTNKKIQIQLNN